VKILILSASSSTVAIGAVCYGISVLASVATLYENENDIVNIDKKAMS
jgi:hypothetical protein